MNEARESAPGASTRAPALPRARAAASPYSFLQLTPELAGLACRQAPRSTKSRLSNRQKGRNHVSKHRFLKASVLGLPLLLLASADGLAQQPQAPDPTRNLTPVTDATLRNPPASDWLMWRRTYNAWGYSPLDQINKGNVKNLQVAWTWSMTNGPTETTPIVHDGVLFIFNYADKVQALNAATGDLIWEFKRDLPAKLVTDGGNPLAKRNMAAASSPATIRRPARSCGASIPSPRPAIRVSIPGTPCRPRLAMAARPGSQAVTTPIRTWCSTGPVNPIRGSRK